jgi:hypothetical protein
MNTTPSRDFLTATGKICIHYLDYIENKFNEEHPVRAYNGHDLSAFTSVFPNQKKMLNNLYNNIDKNEYDALAISDQLSNIINYCGNILNSIQSFAENDSDPYNMSNVYGVDYNDQHSIVDTSRKNIQKAVAYVMDIFITICS